MRHIILQVPWAFLSIQVVNFLIMFLIWLFTRYLNEKNWLKFAPDKAKDVVQELRRALVESELERQQLASENAEMRGRIYGAKRRLHKSDQLQLVERTGV
jgi:hypothetical protein